MKFVRKAINYVRESASELKKVVWPTKKETLNHTLLVISISAGVAVFLGVVDFIMSAGIEKYILE